MIHLHWTASAIVRNPSGDVRFHPSAFLSVTAPASVIGIGGDHSHLSNEKDPYDHVMSPYHRKYLDHPSDGVHSRSDRLAEDDNGSVLPAHGDHQAPADGDAPMDVDDTHQGLQHIPGVDDTTLLSNVSDEFVLPPIATTGRSSSPLNRLETNDVSSVEQHKQHLPHVKQ